MSEPWFVTWIPWVLVIASVIAVHGRYGWVPAVVPIAILFVFWTIGFRGAGQFVAVVVSGILATGCPTHRSVSSSRDG